MAQSPEKVRIAVYGAGVFGRHHMRVIQSLAGAELAGVADSDRTKAAAAAAEFGCPVLEDAAATKERADAAVVAVNTSAHAAVAVPLLERGLHLLIEKPIAQSVAEAQRLVDEAARHGCLLQVGHLERFNPAVAALKAIVRQPLFFEIQRLSLFSPRSLDVDVVLDLMIHDLDIVLDLVGAEPDEIRAAGISILSDKPDIANVRLAFPSGCIANLTASRVSTERVRKLRLFQPGQYISLDYGKQQAVVFRVSSERQIAFENLAVERDEPLRLELEDFVSAIRSRTAPRVTGEAGVRALRLARQILDKIEEHTRLVRQQLTALPPNEG